MGLDTEQKPLAQKGKKYRLICINAQSIIKENGGNHLFFSFLVFLQNKMSGRNKKDEITETVREDT